MVERIDVWGPIFSNDDAPVSLCLPFTVAALLGPQRHVRPQRQTFLSSPLFHLLRVYISFLVLRCHFYRV